MPRALPHTAARTAAHCHTLPYTAALQHCRKLPLALPDTATRTYHTLPHCHTATHCRTSTLPHCCALLHYCTTAHCRTAAHCRSLLHYCTAALPHNAPRTALCRTHRLPHYRILHTTAHCRFTTHCCTHIVTAVTATYSTSIQAPTAALPRTAAHSLAHTAALPHIAACTAT